MPSSLIAPAFRGFDSAPNSRRLTVLPARGPEIGNEVPERETAWMLRNGPAKAIFSQSSMSRSILNLIGVVILILGLGSVALIERNARIADANAIEDSEATHQLLHPEDYGSYVRSAESMGGKFGMLLGQGVDWAGGLGHSRSFAITIAFVSVIAAAGFFARSSVSSRE
jgi:hypothetical protein